MSVNEESRVERSGGNYSLSNISDGMTLWKLKGRGGRGRDGEWHSHVPKGFLCRQVSGIFATHFNWGQAYEREKWRVKRVSRTIWKVWGELQNKWSKIEKVGNVIITVRYRKYIRGGEESKRSCAQVTLDKMFYSFLTLFSCWNYLPSPTNDIPRLFA